ncbi:putative 18S rRNA (guanine-N(7))-methyltransferase [Smittium culicis]|uniref:Putative 18S rRNA (Guanine-N(7))-methyltransferase n=2 Tax=Smittium culicis TaxID=133412 RepID=A0A1R1X0J9_9FUNG|nr:putative 18S rRNA (guanine-N(7))-methyltransferase [Smittium culicis]OMJ17031.1 putative 18S rRNA (guanine-N(7))-methyltransferase [Smittium culicis]
MSRPEHLAPPEIFYNEDEAKKYTSSTRIATIQAEMSARAIELLALPDDEPKFLLDIGCGSGLSGEIIEEEGHYWVDLAVEKDLEGDLFLHDIGHGLGFRPGTFDGAISVSVLQWLCNADKKINKPKYRLMRFFSTLYSSLRRGARAVFQFYPENDDQISMILSSAMSCGFTGGMVIDYPNSKKARKNYLCLFAGSSQASARQNLPAAIGVDDQSTVTNSLREHSRNRGQKGSKRSAVKNKDWVLQKKELYRKRGNKEIPNDSKFTARKRKGAF